jgi:hypothetical protein
MPPKTRASFKPHRPRPTRAASPRKLVPTKNIRPVEVPEESSLPASTSKQQRCINLLSRRDGATLAELIVATEWQAHSVRGFLSGTIKKKLGLSVTSTRDEDGARRYRIDRIGRGR